MDNSLGIDTDAGVGRLTIAAPVSGFPGAAVLRKLAFGGFEVDVNLNGMEIQVCVTAGPRPLEVTLRLPSGHEKTVTLRPGEMASISA